MISTTIPGRSAAYTVCAVSNSVSWDSHNYRTPNGVKTNMDGLPPELPISPKTPKNPIFDPFWGGPGGGQKGGFLGGVGANFWSEGGISSFYFGGGVRPFFGVY